MKYHRDDFVIYCYFFMVAHTMRIIKLGRAGCQSRLSGARVKLIDMQIGSAVSSFVLTK